MYNLKKPELEHFNFGYKVEKKMLIEGFDMGTLAEKNDENEDAAWPKQEGASTTYQFSCYKKARQIEGTTLKRAKSDEEEKQTNFAPKEGQSEFGEMNPVWMIIPILNLGLNIILDMFEIFIWLFKNIFADTYNEIVPKNFIAGTGIKPGKKYCFTLNWFRYLVTFTCPPAGVFMAYGFRGWLQILICSVASLLYYFPGLAYALIIIDRSDVGELIKARESKECSTGVGGFYFASEGGEQPQCSRDVGESCDPEGKPLPEDKNKLSCCANPIAEVDDEGNTTYKVLGKTATDKDGNEITSPEQGQRYCRKDTKEIKQKKGVCVWKSSNKPN